MICVRSCRPRRGRVQNLQPHGTAAKKKRCHASGRVARWPGLARAEVHDGDSATAQQGAADRDRWQAGVPTS